MPIKAILFGDSGAYGVAPTPTGRLDVTPVMNLNAAQPVFDLVYDYSVGGASFSNFFSTVPANRALAGLPGGVDFADLLLSTDAGAILFCMGGLDRNNIQGLAANIRRAASLCQLASKHFAFVGVCEINASASYAYTPIGADFWSSENLATCVGIAAANEVLRQTCLRQGYPFVDVRTLVPVASWSDVTCDVIHPSQTYSTAIFNKVGRCIAGLP